VLPCSPIGRNRAPITRARAPRPRRLFQPAVLLIINKPVLSPRLFYVRVLPRCILMRVAAQEARITSHDEWREVEPAPSNNTREVGFPRSADRIKSWESSRRSSIIPACPGDGEGKRERERERKRRAHFSPTRSIRSLQLETSSPPSLPRGLLLSRSAVVTFISDTRRWLRSALLDMSRANP